jgi:hypothetical protein
VKELEKRGRYLLLLLENGRLGWPALNKTQISQFGLGLADNDDHKIGDHLYNLDITLPRDDADLHKWNLKAEIFPLNYNLHGRSSPITVMGYFGVSSLELVEWSIDKGLPRQVPEVDDLLDDIENGDETRNAITQVLTKKFRFQHNSLSHTDATEFFHDQGQYFDIRLRQFGQFEFLTAEKTY